jgi:hypothetical protein
VRNYLSTQPQSDQLSNKAYITVILRVLIDKQGRLVHGEVIDQQGHLRSRFSSWQWLGTAVRSALQALVDETGADSSQ